MSGLTWIFVPLNNHHVVFVVTNVAFVIPHSLDNVLCNNCKAAASAVTVFFVFFFLVFLRFSDILACILKFRMEC